MFVYRHSFFKYLFNIASVFILVGCPLKKTETDNKNVDELPPIEKSDPNDQSPILTNPKDVESNKENNVVVATVDIGVRIMNKEVFDIIKGVNGTLTCEDGSKDHLYFLKKDEDIIYAIDDKNEKKHLLMTKKCDLMIEKFILFDDSIERVVMLKYLPSLPMAFGSSIEVESGKEETESIKIFNISFNKDENFSLVTTAEEYCKKVWYEPYNDDPASVLDKSDIDILTFTSFKKFDETKDSYIYFRVEDISEDQHGMAPGDRCLILNLTDKNIALLKNIDFSSEDLRRAGCNGGDFGLFKNIKEFNFDGVETLYLDKYMEVIQFRDDSV